MEDNGINEMADYKARICPFNFCPELSVGRSYAVWYRRLENAGITPSGTHNQTCHECEEHNCVCP